MCEVNFALTLSLTFAARQGFRWSIRLKPFASNAEIAKTAE
jgi:hypothetical protein